MALDLHVQSSGDPGLPALILVHGAGAASRMWRGQAALADRFHVLAVDLPGFGLSPGPFTMPGAIEAIAEMARAHRPAHLCGHSLGSLVVTEVAARYADSVGKLVLVGPVLVPARSGPRQIRFYRSLPGWWLMRLLSDLPNRTALRAVVDEIESADVTEAATRIAAPTLVVCGKRDRSALPDARRLSDLIPASRLLVVPHTGHLLPVAQPKVFNAIAAGFLDSPHSSRSQS